MDDRGDPSQVSFDVRSPSAGTLVEQMAGEGDTVEVGAALMKVDTSGAGAAPGECCREGEACLLPSAARSRSSPFYCFKKMS